MKHRVSKSSQIHTSCLLQVSLTDISPYFIEDHQEAVAITHIKYEISQENNIVLMHFKDLTQAQNVLLQKYNCL